MTIEVTEDKLEEIKRLVLSWLQKDMSNLKELQSLVEKLNFVAACVRPGRMFISRLINWMRELYQEDKNVSVTVPEEVRKDILWWHKFLDVYNGVSIMSYGDWSSPDEIISTGACLTGAGGYFKGKFFHVKFNKRF